jgi:acetyltransferase-like isoleucine patch superfamily enzyme
MGNIHSTAEVHQSVLVPNSTQIWQFTHVRENVVIGENCIIGRNVYIGPGVIIGNNCKIQNNALIYEPAILEDGVFIGPAVILTNDKYPRAINRDGSIKTSQDWDRVGVTLRKGVSIGANSVCIAPIEIGIWAAIGANTVVSSDVSPFKMAVGNPAKVIGDAKY